MCKDRAGEDFSNIPIEVTYSLFGVSRLAMDQSFKLSMLTFLNKDNACPQHWWKVLSSWVVRRNKALLNNFFFRSFEGRLKSGAWLDTAKGLSHDLLQCLHSNREVWVLALKWAVTWKQHYWKLSLSSVCVLVKILTNIDSTPISN